MMSARRAGGFTLIEIIVALAVLGVAVVILLESHFATIRLIAQVEDQSREELAIGQAAALAEREVLAGNETGEGKLGARFPDYTFTFTATERDQTEFPGLFEVEVIVRGPDFERTLQYLVYHGAQVDVGQ